jgi:hypothetical protein
VCRVCDGVFSEHQVRLKAEEPEEDQVQCPSCGSSRMEPYAFDPEAPMENPFEQEDEGALGAGSRTAPYSSSSRQLRSFGSPSTTENVASILRRALP